MELYTQLLSRIVELSFVNRLLYRGGDKSKRTTVGLVKTFAAVGLNLLKESEISAPHPEEIYFFILFSIVVFQFYYLVSFFTINLKEIQDGYN